MTQVTLKSGICFLLMLVSLVTALITKDVMSSKLCASFALILGGLATQTLSTKSIVEK